MAGIAAETEWFTSDDKRPRGVLGTRIPSSVCLCVGLLLFFMPFAELQCRSKNKDDERNRFRFHVTFSNTGLGLALGQQWKWSVPALARQSSEAQNNEWKKNTESSGPNEYALVALILAAVATLLSFFRAKVAVILSMVSAVLTPVALIGLMIDLRKKSTGLVTDAQQAGNISDTINAPELVLVFTPWFYVALLCFIAAAFFSYKRLQSLK